MKTLLLSIFAFALFMGCSGNATREYTAEQFRIQITRTECFGKCPAYTLSIAGDGSCALEGRKNVDNIGKFKRTISKELVAELAQGVEDCNFFSLEKEYTAQVTDLPTTVVSVKLDDNSKTIRDYYGAPEKLRRFESKLDSIRRLGGWTEAK